MRLEFSKKTKLAAWQRESGHCQGCGKEIRPGDGPEYDHDKEAFFDGTNELENCRVLCIPCHGSKTSARRPVIDKTRGLIKKAAGIKKPSKFRRPPPGYKFNWNHGRYEKI